MISLAKVSVKKERLKQGSGHCIVAASFVKRLQDSGLASSSTCLPIKSRDIRGLRVIPPQSAPALHIDQP